MGSMQITCGASSYDSSERSVMILITITGMLDAVLKLKRDRQQTSVQYGFSGIGSSVEAKFHMVRGLVRVQVSNQYLGSVTLEELAVAVGDASHTFYDSVRQRIPHSDAGKADFECSMSEFDRQFPPG